MPTYYYKAKKGPQESFEGTLDADNFDHAISKLIGMGYVPIDVTLAPSASLEKRLATRPLIPSFSSRVPKKEIALFTRQLADLMAAGVPLLWAINLLISPIKNPSFRQTIQQIRDMVQDGMALSEALKKYPHIFPSLYSQMVRAGEVGGDLSVVLSRLADFLEKDEEVKSKVVGSLIYPALMLIVGIITIFVLLSFVIPKLTVMFEDLSETLPLPTTILLNLSGFFHRFWILVVLGGLLAIYLFQKFTHTGEGRLWLDRWKLKIPVLGEFLLNVEIGRFARTLATLLENGVVIVPALETAADVLDNAALHVEIKEVAQNVAQGNSLSHALERCRFFPQIAINMMAVGEESGRLPAALHKLAASYEKYAEGVMKTFTSLLEPLLIVIIGGIVGFIVISLLLPIFRMNLIIQ